jgi:hypothetical protein
VESARNLKAPLQIALQIPSAPLGLSPAGWTMSLGFEADYSRVYRAPAGARRAVWPVRPACGVRPTDRDEHAVRPFGEERK